MPRYYCDYCDTYLTHDSPSVRKQHNAGYKHKANVRTYYQQFEEQQTQSLIDQKIKEHLGQAAYQVGATFNQFLQANPQRPRLPILPPPILPMGAHPQMPMGSPFAPGFRPPILPPPMSGAPPVSGYGAVSTVPPSMAPPGATSMPMQMNTFLRPPTMNPPAIGVATTPTSNGASTITECLPNGLHERYHVRNDKEPGLNAGASSKASASVDFSSEALPDDPEGYSYPNPEFYDFEGERDASKFAVDQIWAIYDNSDAMPRYYVLIRHVYRPKFKLQFNWLEYEPTSKAETLWYDGGLPIGCGTFKRGTAELTNERLMFSHLMPWKKGTKKNTYDILPRKGEVWAVFKNWDFEWSSCVDTNRHYEYEIVEVVSDFTERSMVSVVQLVKVQGFVSLFVQAVDNGSSRLNIQCKDILQFSHNIPSYRLEGNEREGIPEGSLELDCASLPINFADLFPSVSVESVLGRAGDLNNVCNGLHSKSAGSNAEAPTCTTNMSSPQVTGISGGSKRYAESQATCKLEVGTKEDAPEPSNSTAVKNHTVSHQSSSIPTCYEYPDSEFHNFEEERLAGKFEDGQIWALYSDVDHNPNYYGQISKVQLERFEVHVTWLDGYTENEHEKLWLEGQLPVGCGTFKVSRETIVLDTTETFSHIVHAKPASKKNHYSIYPHIGEIWAVYKNWSIRWSLSDHENCGFDIVEVLATDSAGFEVLVLSKVKGYTAVFKAESGISSRTMHIPLGEHLKFSHKIPCFRLTGERGGKLQGYWELDPAAVPNLLLVTDST